MYRLSQYDADHHFPHKIELERLNQRVQIIGENGENGEKVATLNNILL